MTTAGRSVDVENIYRSRCIRLLSLIPISKPPLAPLINCFPRRFVLLEPTTAFRSIKNDLDICHHYSIAFQDISRHLINDSQSFGQSDTDNDILSPPRPAPVRIPGAPISLSWTKFETLKYELGVLTLETRLKAQDTLSNK